MSLPMDRAQLISLGGLILGTSIVSLTYERSFALDHISTTSSSVFALTACLLLVVLRFRPAFLSPGSPPTEVRRFSPTDELPLATTRLDTPPDTPVSPADEGASPYPPTTGHAQWQPIALATAALVLRIVLAQWIVEDIECAWRGVEGLLPLALAVTLVLDASSTSRTELDWNKAKLLSQVGDRLSGSALSSLLPAFLLTCGAVLSSHAASTKSTYICSTASGQKTPLVQIASVLLDFMILRSLPGVLGTAGSRSLRRTRSPLVLGAFVLLAAGLTVQLLGYTAYAQVEHRRPWAATFVPQYPSSAFWSAVVLAGTIIFAIRSVSHLKPLTPLLTVFGTFAYTQVLSATWSRGAFPPLPVGHILLSATFLFASLVIYGVDGAPKFRLHLRTTSALNSLAMIRSLPWWSGPLLALYLLQVFSVVKTADSVSLHPVERLMEDAARQHAAYLKQASVGKNSLEAAVAEYHRRYNRHPPPRFDKWYEYATTQGSLIIDDYDSIHQNMLPFWSLTPTQIRDRTWEMTSNPWNEISGISIRNGKAELGANTLPTHRWMLEGVAIMINRFAEHLPDMDIAMNLNDECRVAVEYERLQVMRKAGEDAGNLNTTIRPRFSLHRDEKWQDVPKYPINSTRFEDLSFTNTFYTYAAPACPPGSKARTERFWDRGSFCKSCASPHSLGPFVSNWTAAASICHQPDLANLNGFLTSPAAFKSTHALMPVFSQSKVAGYNDILYPSAWNYNDKVAYAPSSLDPDPPFRSKTPTLFWRGATSEGVSTEGTWKGMTRQRAIHLANNLTSSDAVSLVLPTSPGFFGRGRSHTYTSVAATGLGDLAHPRLSVYTVDHIARCGGRDCADQAAQLAFARPTDFQHHWSYKYLLDLDGAGFSGRFLPFLQSRSLPFKTALFREWYDDRLAAWLHFVPIDARLHGVWSTLAYFAGLKGGKAGWNVPAHDREAMHIAERGQNWASKVLRKADMEVYFFRLLLEWGRMTDDQRHRIGFVLSQRK